MQFFARCFIPLAGRARRRGAQWERNVTDLAGGYALSQTSTGSRDLHLADPHGDLVATLDLATPG